MGTENCYRFTIKRERKEAST